MAWHYYKNWGGPGFSDGHYTLPGENINWNGLTDGPVDAQFRDHDHGYYDAESAYAGSYKFESDRVRYWEAIKAADIALVLELQRLQAEGSLGYQDAAVAQQAKAAFLLKLISDQQSLNERADPDANAIGDVIDASRDLVTGMRIPGAIGIVVNTATTLALNWVAPRRDPLVLDLDGNGISTSAINPLAPILFDQDGDGTLTATGWIGAGEAIVVRDLNGNGTIDSGRELFGDATVLTQGPRVGQLAANGFEALADLDSNLDGKFDATDAAFASVKLWKDANQNGISEAGELFTLNDLGVASVNVAGTASNVNLGGGNTQTFAGSFTRTSGQAGTAGTAELAGSLLLANNNFYRQFTDDPAITAGAQGLPQMQGSGLVRDLRPAMSLGTAQALDLQTKLAQFAADTTKAQQQADLDAVVQSWGATSAMPTSIQTNRTTNDHQTTTVIEQFALGNPSVYAQITALERFNGNAILERWVRASGSTNAVSFSAHNKH
jgi:hypothetical protein